MSAIAGIFHPDRAPIDLARLNTIASPPPDGSKIGFACRARNELTRSVHDARIPPRLKQEMIPHRISNIPATLGRLSALLILLAVSACAPAPSAPPTAAPAPTKLKLVYSRFLSYAPFFIADAEGFFKAQNLDVELVSVTSQTQALPALLQGETDAGAMSISPAFLNAITRGGRMRMVADKGYIARSGCPNYVIVARTELAKSKRLDDPNNLRGLAYRVDVSNVSGYLAERFLSTKGLALSDIKNVSVPDEVLSEAFRKGTVDLANTNEPLTTRILNEQSGVVLATSEELIPDFQLSFTFYGPNLLDKNPSAGKRLMVALLQATRQYNQGKTDRNVEIISKYTGQTPDIVRQACWQPMRDDGSVNLKSLGDIQNFFVRHKVLDAPITEDRNLFDSSFIEYANQALKK